MEAIRQWAFSLCAAGVACSLIQITAPKTPTRKLLQLTVSTFFLCAIFAPIIIPSTSFELDLRIDDSLNRAQSIAEDMRSGLNEDIRNITEQTLAAQIADDLKKAGIKVIKITLNINTLVDQSIEIYGVEILAEREYSAREPEIIALLKDNFNLKVTVKYR